MIPIRYGVAIGLVILASRYGNWLSQLSLLVSSMERSEWMFSIQPQQSQQQLKQQSKTVSIRMDNQWIQCPRLDPLHMIGHRIHDTMDDTTTPLKCALLFFGVPRLFTEKALPTIQTNLLDANPNCDIYIHTYNVSTISSGRDTVHERHQQINITQVYDMPSAHVRVESMESFYQRRNLTWFHEHHHKVTWGPCCLPTDNMIKQWHSIHGVWEYMEHCVTTQMIQLQQQWQLANTSTNPLDKSNNNINNYYQRIGLFRLDVLYPEPIYIGNTSEPAVVPAFLWNGFKKPNDMADSKITNDRMFYGDTKYAKFWATERFSYAQRYVQQFQR